jgi:uncharacterized Tic20 family protein
MSEPPEPPLQPPLPPPLEPPPGSPLPPPGYGSRDEKTWALVAHFGGAAGVLLLGWGGFIAPLIALVGKSDSPTIRTHAVRALNFQLTWLGVSVVLATVLCCVTALTLGIGALGFVLLGVPYVIAIVFGVIAGVKATDGILYDYPMTVEMVK